MPDERKGFASRDPDKGHEVASKSGRAAHLEGTADEWAHEGAAAPIAKLPRAMLVDTNTLVRSEWCPSCGAKMLWTQNTWPTNNVLIKRAAYRCPSGHLVDPATTRQCPECGIHDTHLVERREDGQDVCRCNRCHRAFTRRRAVEALQ